MCTTPSLNLTTATLSFTKSTNSTMPAPSAPPNLIPIRSWSQQVMCRLMEEVSTSIFQLYLTEPKAKILKQKARNKE